MYPDPQDIIRKQIEQHTNYTLKTEYSKEKYKKKKTAKLSNVLFAYRPHYSPSVVQVFEDFYSP